MNLLGINRHLFTWVTVASETQIGPPSLTGLINWNVIFLLWYILPGSVLFYSRSVRINDDRRLPDKEKLQLSWLWDNLMLVWNVLAHYIGYFSLRLSVPSSESNFPCCNLALPKCELPLIIDRSVLFIRTLSCSFIWSAHEFESQGRGQHHTQ